MNFFRRNRVRQGTPTTTNNTYNDPAYGTSTTNTGTYGTNTGPGIGRNHRIANNYDTTAGTGHNHRTANNYDTTAGTGIGSRTGRTRGAGGGGGLFGKRHHRDRDLEYAGEKPRNRAIFDVTSGDFNHRPSFGQWLKFTVLDLLTMIAMGAIGLGVYNANPAPSRSFPITFQNGNIVYPEFAYPVRREIVPIWLAALLASIIPIFIILIMQIRIRSFWDINNAIIGLLYSLITAAVFQVFIKWLIGGLRPHFYDVCQPNVDLITAGGNGFRSLMFDRSVCTGDRNQINDSLESMPSGHSTAAFAGFIYLYLYLNAKLKVFANYHPAMWKLIAVYAPVLGACLIAGSLTIDQFHNWYDCLAGALIGAVMAFSAYRMVYASVWDFRFNHIPLTRHTPFSYGAGEAGAGGFESAVFTRRAGWGYEEAYGGAPFDAAHHLRGTMAGFNNAVHNHSYGQNGQHGSAGGGFMSKLTHRNHNNGVDGRQSLDDRNHNHHHNHHAGADTAATAAAAGVAAEHHHDRNSRLDDHQHQHGLGHHNRNMSGDYPATTTGTTGLGGHHHDRDRAGYPTQTTQTAVHETSHHRSGGGGGIGGLFHHGRRSGDYTNDGISHNDIDGTGLLHHDRERDRDTRDVRDNTYAGDNSVNGPNRFRIHSRSLERKALPRTQQGVVV